MMKTEAQTGKQKQVDMTRSGLPVNGSAAYNSAKVTVLPHYYVSRLKTLLCSNELITRRGGIALRRCGKGGKNYRGIKIYDIVEI